VQITAPVYAGKCISSFRSADVWGQT